VSVQNPFDAVKWILGSVIQTQVNNRLAVETFLVEQLRHGCVNGFLAVLAPIPLDGDRNFFEAVLGDEDDEDACPRVVYRVEGRVTEHFDDIGVSQTQLDETYADRSQVENTINVCKEGSLGRVRARDRAMAKAHLSLCLRLVVAITNYEKGVI